MQPARRRTSCRSEILYVRRIVITAIALVVAGLTATTALANSPHFKKGREPSCRNAGAAISKSAACKAVFAGLAVQASVPDNGNTTLPYDESGLGANQPNQPRVGSVGPKTERAVADVAVQASVPDNGNSHAAVRRARTARTSRTSRRSVSVGPQTEQG